MAVVGEDCELGCLTFAELEDQLATLASHIYAGTCRWLELVAELDRRGEPAGCSCAEWLAWRCGLTSRTAREHVRIARRLGELPLVHTAFAAGELSFAKVRALTRTAEPATEEELLRLAFELTAAQLERALRAYSRVTTEEAVAVQAAAYVDWYWDDDGSLVLRGRLAPEDGAMFVQALDAARSGLRERRGETEGGSAEPWPTNADALAAVADAALSTVGADRSGGDRHQVVVHVDEALCPAREQEVASSPMVRPSRRRRLEGLRVTPRWFASAREAATRFPWVERRARSLPLYGERCNGVTAAADSPVARTGASWMLTTSAIGLAEARRGSTIWLSSAGAIIGSSTKAATRSNASGEKSSSFVIHRVRRSPAYPGRRQVISIDCWRPIGGS